MSYILRGALQQQKIVYIVMKLITCHSLLIDSDHFEGLIHNDFFVVKCYLDHK